MCCKAPILIGLLLRLALALVAWMQSGIDGQCFWMPDTPTYIAPAIELAHHFRFYNAAGSPEFFRTPGYSLLLAPGAWLGITELWGIFLQTMMGVAMIPLVAWISRQVFPNQDGRVAAWWQAIDPLSIVLGAVLLSETSFTLCVIGALALLLKPKASTSVGAGLLLGFAIWIRPAGLFLPLAIFPFLLWKHKAKYAFAFLFCALLFPAAWTIRNAHYEYPHYSTSSAELADCYVRPAVIAHATSKSYYALRDEYGCTNGSAFKDPQDLRNQRAKEAVSTYPISAAIVHMKGVIRTLLDPGIIDAYRILGVYPSQGGLLGIANDKGLFAALTSFAQTHPILLGFFLATALLLLLFYFHTLWGIKSAWQSRKNIDSWHLILLSVLGGYFIFFSGGPQAIARFRHPLVPLMAIIASRARKS